MQNDEIEVLRIFSNMPIDHVCYPTYSCQKLNGPPCSLFGAKKAIPLEQSLGWNLYNRGPLEEISKTEVLWLKSLKQRSFRWNLYNGGLLGEISTTEVFWVKSLQRKSIGWWLNSRGPLDEISTTKVF